METKKKVERDCLDKTKAYISFASKATRDIISLLDGEISESESPDFIIKRKSGYIGVEHFLVDTLIGKKKASRNRIRPAEINRTYNRYHNRLEGNEEKALHEIESLAQAEVDAIQNFDYSIFIGEFERIVTEHANRTAGYRNQHDEIEQIVFLVEIPIPGNKMYGLTTGGNWDLIKGERFPLTIDMLMILKKITDKIDYVILSIIHDSYTKRAFTVYTFDCNCIEESIAPQINELFVCFTYDWQMNPKKVTVKLSLGD